MSQSISATPEKAASDHQPLADWYVYIVENKLGQLYTGITIDVQRRIFEHAHHPTKGAKSLRGKGPLTLRFEKKVGTHSDALKCERWVKAQRREKKLALIKRDIELPF